MKFTGRTVGETTDYFWNHYNRTTSLTNLPGVGEGEGLVGRDRGKQSICHERHVVLVHHHVTVVCLRLPLQHLQL